MVLINSLVHSDNPPVGFIDENSFKRVDSVRELIFGKARRISLKNGFPLILIIYIRPLSIFFAEILVHC